MARIRYGVPLWLDRLPASKRPVYPRFKSSSPVETDVVIVGGGLAGCMSAYLFAHAGVRVTLLEAARLGQNTAASLGLLPDQPGASFRTLQDAYGLRTAKRAWESTRKAALDAATLLRRLNIRADLDRADTILVALDPNQERTLRREQQALADAGFDATWVKARRAASETQAEGVLGALRTRGGGWCDPYRVCLGLAAAAEKEGAQLHEQSEVVKVRAGRKRVEVRTRTGTLDARAILMATNEPGLGCGALRRHVRVTDSYIVATPPLKGPLLRTVGPRDTVLRDFGDPAAAISSSILWSHTLCHTKDDRVLFQGAAQPPVPPRQRDKAIIQRTGQLMYELSRLFPAVSGLLPEHGWSIRHVTALDGLLLAGPHRNLPRHLFAIGLGNAGVTGAYLAARILLRSYAGTPEPADEVFGFSRLPR
jgi:glycine/D-amino acid oxidase-like deaminating enzyme